MSILWGILCLANHLHPFMITDGLSGLLTADASPGDTEIFTMEVVMISNNTMDMAWGLATGVSYAIS